MTMVVACWFSRSCISRLPEGGDVRSYCCCGRRQMLAATPAILLGTNANAASLEASSVVSKKPVFSSKPDWYKELYAETMNSSMQAYEKEISRYKARLFQQIDPTAETIVELGIGTGPNLKYYADRAGTSSIIGIDPNDKMEKYASKAASRAGLPASRFKFLQAIGEMLPLPTSSVDSVVCTLVLCSVTDVSSSLQEVRRVLKPGGCFLFIEHVAAQEGTALRFWQNLLDPVQQLVADGCHLTRDTLSTIQAAKFSSVQAERIELKGAALIAPHVVGMAQA